MQIKTYVILLLGLAFSQPLLGLYSLLPFVLVHDLSTSPYFLALFLSMRPVLPLIAPFYSSLFPKNGKGIHTSMIVAFLITTLLFVYTFFSLSFFSLLFSAACFQLLNKGLLPITTQLLQNKVSETHHTKLLSHSYIVGFTMTCVSGVVGGYFLDRSSTYLPFILLATYMLYSVSILCLVYVNNIVDLTFHSENLPVHKNNRRINTTIEMLFHAAFMLGGGVLMVSSPALTVIYSEILQLSYLDIATARFVYMTLGVAIATPFWNKGVKERGILFVTPLILLGFGIFLQGIALSSFYKSTVYFAFFIYGVSQSGSHLVWNYMPLYMRSSSSIPYTQRNIFLVGLRGAIFPFFGAYLITQYSSINVVRWASYASLLSALILAFFLIYKRPLAYVNKHK